MIGCSCVGIAIFFPSNNLCKMWRREKKIATIHLDRTFSFHLNIKIIFTVSQIIWHAKLKQHRTFDTFYIVEALLSFGINCWTFSLTIRSIFFLLLIHFQEPRTFSSQTNSIWESNWRANSKPDYFNRLKEVHTQRLLIER